VGGYAGWWGADFLGWPPALGLIGAVVCLGGLGAFLDWLQRARGRVEYPWRWVLVALTVYGLLGGLAMGAICWFSGLVIAAFVGWIADRPPRVAAGVFVSLAVSSVGTWLASRRRLRAQHNGSMNPPKAAGPDLADSVDQSVRTRPGG
jgi:hypothetical protein